MAVTSIHTAPLRASVVARELDEAIARSGTACWRDILRLGIALGREQRFKTEAEQTEFLNLRLSDGPEGLTKWLAEKRHKL